MQVRLFGREDTSSVLELASACAAFDGTTSEADLAITPHFPSGFWVAEDNGKLVGFVYGYFPDVPSEILTKWKSSKVGQIELMAVRPGYRRSGIGQTLLKKLLEEFKRAGGDLILVNFPESALEAKRVYEDMGFGVRFYQLKKSLRRVSETSVVGVQA